MGAEFIIYIVVSCMVALAISKKTDRKLLSFALVFWIFTQPVITAFVAIKIPGLNIDMNPNRVLFLFALVYLLFGTASARSYANVPAAANKRPPFEKYLYVYTVLVFVAIAANYAMLDAKSIGATPLEVVSFIAVFTLAKKHVTPSVLEAILKAVVILSMLTIFVTIIQATVGPLFLRTGEAKAAFGTTLRAFGIFRFDGELGAFQVLALMIMLVRYRGMARLYLLVPLLCLSIFVSFHRLGYITLFVCLLTYVLLFSKKKLSSILIMLIVPGLLILAYSAYRAGGDQSAIESRLGQDTVSGRLAQYGVALATVPTHPLGMGGYENPAYAKLMEKYDMVQWLPDRLGIQHPEPLAIHNGYLEVGIKYGAMGMITFIALLVSLLRYFKKRASSPYRYAIVPFFAVLVWMLSNTSQAAASFNAYFVILQAIIYGSFVAIYRTGADKQPAKTVDAGVIKKPT